jgi:Fic family protein
MRKRTPVSIDLKERMFFLYHSNRIEEIQIPLERYAAFEESSYSEIKGHAEALDYLLDNYREELTERDICVMHGLLTHGLLSPERSGVYRTCKVWIGGREGLNTLVIQPAMERLITKAKKAKTADQCWEIHDNFEHIHPFVDGNGRTGRLILNWLRLHNGLKFYTVSSQDKTRLAYYDNISRRPFDLFDK